MNQFAFSSSRVKMNVLFVFSCFALYLGNLLTGEDGIVRCLSIASRPPIRLTEQSQPNLRRVRLIPLEKVPTHCCTIPDRDDYPVNKLIHRGDPRSLCEKSVS